jgi:DNA-directed RNA polymerase subunit RPC12/RpoP
MRAMVARFAAPEPHELAQRHRLDMVTPLLKISKAMRCTRCGARRVVAGRSRTIRGVAAEKENARRQRTSPGTSARASWGLTATQSGVPQPSAKKDAHGNTGQDWSRTALGVTDDGKPDCRHQADRRRDANLDQSRPLIPKRHGHVYADDAPDLRILVSQPEDAGDLLVAFDIGAPDHQASVG